MKENSKMVILKEKEYTFSIMVKDMKDISIIMKLMEMEFIFLIMVIRQKEISQRMLQLVFILRNLQMVSSKKLLIK